MLFADDAGDLNGVVALSAGLPLAGSTAVSFGTAGRGRRGFGSLFRVPFNGFVGELSPIFFVVNGFNFKLLLLLAMVVGLRPGVIFKLPI